MSLILMLTLFYSEKPLSNDSFTYPILDLAFNQSVHSLNKDLNLKESEVLSNLSSEESTNNVLKIEENESNSEESNNAQSLNSSNSHLSSAQFNSSKEDSSTTTSSSSSSTSSSLSSDSLLPNLTHFELKAENVNTSQENQQIEHKDSNKSDRSNQSDVETNPTFVEKSNKSENILDEAKSSVDKKNGNLVESTLKNTESKPSLEMNLSTSNNETNLDDVKNESLVSNLEKSESSNLSQTNQKDKIYNHSLKDSLKSEELNYSDKLNEVYKIEENASLSKQEVKLDNKDDKNNNDLNLLDKMELKNDSDYDVKKSRLGAARNVIYNMLKYDDDNETQNKTEEEDKIENKVKEEEEIKDKRDQESEEKTQKDVQNVKTETDSKRLNISEDVDEDMLRKKDIDSRLNYSVNLMDNQQMSSMDKTNVELVRDEAANEVKNKSTQNENVANKSSVQELNISEKQPHLTVNSKNNMFDELTTYSTLEDTKNDVDIIPLLNDESSTESLKVSSVPHSTPVYPIDIQIDISTTENLIFNSEDTKEDISPVMEAETEATVLVNQLDDQLNEIIEQR